MSMMVGNTIIKILLINGFKHRNWNRLLI